MTPPTKWTNQPWHAPSGREIWLNEGDEPHELELTFPDETRRYLHYVGELPVTVKIDGEHYERVDDDEEWEVSNGYITAIVRGGVRYERVDV